MLSMLAVKNDAKHRYFDTMRKKNSIEEEVTNFIRDCELFQAYQDNTKISMSVKTVNTSCFNAYNSLRNRQGQQQQVRKNHDFENKGYYASWEVWDASSCIN